MNEPMNPVLFDKEVHTIERAASVREAVAVMAANEVSSVLVVEGHKPVGIFTERDAVRRVLHGGLDPQTTRVEQVMSGDVRSIGPDTRIQDALTLMARGPFRHLPVVDEGRLVGMVSVGDLTHEVKWQNDHLIGYITGAPR